MNDPQNVSPQRRLQELLAIQDSQRSEEEWDELNELEIQLAPVNREGAPEPRTQRQNQGGHKRPPQSRPQSHSQSAPNNPNANSAPGTSPSQPKRSTTRRFRKRPPKPAQPV